MVLRSINYKLYNEFIKDPLYTNTEIVQPIRECFYQFKSLQNLSDDNEKIRTINELISNINNRIGHIKKVKNIYIKKFGICNYFIEFECGLHVNYSYGLFFKRFFPFYPVDTMHFYLW